MKGFCVLGLVFKIFREEPEKIVSEMKNGKQLVDAIPF